MSTAGRAVAAEASKATPSHRKPLIKQMWLWVAIAMVLGVILGITDPSLGVAMGPLGTGFIKLISMTIAPLVFCTMVNGIARMANMARLGKIVLKTLVVFEVMSVAAMTISMIVIDVLQPGKGMNISLSAINTSSITPYTQHLGKFDLVQFLLNIIPDTFGGAFTDHNLLPVLFLSIICGFAILGLGEKAAPFNTVLNSFLEMIFGVIRIIMYAAPVGAFGAIAFGIGKFGAVSIIPLSKFIGEFWLADLLIIFGFGFTISAWCGFNFFKYLRYFWEEILIGLATTSSEVVMPQMIAKTDRLGCKGIAGLTIPAAYSFYPVGIGTYLCMVCLFLAQAMNIPVSIGQQVALVLLIHLTSRSVVGVAGIAFVVLFNTMSAWGVVPLATGALVLGIHRLLAEGLVTNLVATNPLATLVVARWENVLDVAQLRRVLDEPEAVEEGQLS